MTRYEIHWYSDDGELQQVISDFHKLEYVRVENDVGVLTLTLPLGDWEYEDIQLDSILEIWRERDGVINLQNETAYFVRDWRIYTDSNDEDYIGITAYDANYLLDGAIVAYANGTSGADKTDYADDMMKEVVSENLGADTGDTDRTKISVAADASECTSISKEFPRRNVLAVCKEIAEKATQDDEYLVFDVVRTEPCEFEFRTYFGQRGVDRGQGSDNLLIVSRATGNLLESSFSTVHAHERNYIYVGGYTTCSDSSRETASEWNRREMHAIGNGSSGTADNTSEGDAKLEEYKPMKMITGNLIDTTGVRFGAEYGFGDILAVEAFGYVVDCHLTKVHVSVDQDGGEKLSCKLEGEL